MRVDTNSNPRAEPARLHLAPVSRTNPRRNSSLAFRNIVAGAAIGALVITCMFALLALVPLPSGERSRARADAGRLLRLVGPATGCGGGCAAEAVDSEQWYMWRVRLTGHWWQRCFVLDLRIFAGDVKHGFSGVSLAPCPGPPPRAPSHDTFRRTATRL